jgi:hypothetical protein
VDIEWLEGSGESVGLSDATVDFLTMPRRYEIDTEHDLEVYAKNSRGK